MSQAIRHKQTSALSIDWATMFLSQVIDFGAKITAKDNTNTEAKFNNPLKNIKFPTEKFKKLISTRKKKQITITIILALTLTGVIFLFKVLGSNTGSLVGKSSVTNFSPGTQSTINRKFEIPIRDAKGVVTGSNLGITISTVDRSKRILIQGKPATARDTKSFLILNLEVNNSTTNQLTIRPVDFIRLVDSQENSFAPDVHNNEVIAEPVSIKRTRVGFVIDEDQNSFKFLVGELKGNKETVEVTF